MGSLLIVTGPPGAGKSTVAALLAARYDLSALVEGDAFFAFLRSGAIEPWLPASQTQNEVVTDAAASATAAFVAGGYDTVYDGVMGPWFLPAFARRMQLREFDYAVVLPSVDACVERVATRAGHGFTDESATRSMHAQFDGHRPADRHVFDGDDDEAGDIVEQILDRRAGRLLCVSSHDLGAA